MQEKINMLLEHANRKLKYITKDGFPVAFPDVELSVDGNDEILTVMSGSTVVITVACNGDFDTVKKAVWKMVDDTRAQVEALNGPTEDGEAAPDVSGIVDAQEAVARIKNILKSANEELADIVKGGYPFSFGDVVMTMEADSAGIYIHSGETPVSAVARAGSPALAVRHVFDDVRHFVDATRAATERRGSLKDEAEKLKAESENIATAKAVMLEKGLSLDLLAGNVNEEAAAAVVKAAEEAVREANKSPYLGVAKYSRWRLRVKGFVGGLVIFAGKDPCLVTRYPKIVNAGTIERMVTFIRADVQAVDIDRRAYYARVQATALREERLRAAAQAAADNDRAIAAEM